ncbi:MAG: SAM-dependent methyltransferase [Acidobacteriia bacterium]|nr:SAM-dependent methyltransferase [Terriglobia bacterium]
MPSPITLTAIGTVHSEIREPLDEVFGGLTARIELDPARFKPDSLKGLGEFSHVEVFFYFHQLDDSHIVYTTRHPRNRPDWPEVGIFAQRARARPSRIGSTVCRLVSVEGLAVTVEDLDAIDGTPVLDIKPWMSVMGPRGPVREPAWARELMTTYWRPAK